MRFGNGDGNNMPGKRQAPGGAKPSRSTIENDEDEIMISLRDIVATKNMELFAQYCEGLTFDDVREHGRMLRVDMSELESMILSVKGGQ